MTKQKELSEQELMNLDTEMIEHDNMNKVINTNEELKSELDKRELRIKDLEAKVLSDRKVIANQKNIIDSLFNKELEAKGSSNQGTTAKEVVDKIFKGENNGR